MGILKETDILISDANVLIDFIKAGAEKILKEVGKLHKIYVPTPIYHEVRQLTSAKMEDIGLIEYEPSIELLYQASLKIGQCSPQDALCLLICDNMGWCCLTNDKNLRGQCTKKDVKTVWGLQLLLYLKDKGIINKDTGKRICLKIANTNKMITADIVSKFLEKIE